MKKIHLLFSFLFFLIALTPLIYPARKINFIIDNTYYNNIKYKIINGKIYIDLSQLSKILNLKTILNTKKNIIYLNSNKIDTQNLKFKYKKSKPIIYGQVLYKKSDFIIPIYNCAVKIFKPDKDYPIDIEIEQYKLSKENKDSWWQATHGIVREAKSDKNGYFYFYNLPKGRYTLVGFTNFNNKKIIWIKKIIIKSNKKIKINLFIKDADIIQ